MVISLIGLARGLQQQYHATGRKDILGVIQIIQDLHRVTGVDVLYRIPSDKINLGTFENQKYSQFKEDGITEKIFEVIGTTNKFYLDFGGTEDTNNSEVLHKEHGFKGVLWNGGDINCPYTKVHKEFVTAENIVDLMKKYEIPDEFDFLSIDIDGNDWYVWKALCESGKKPRVIVIEYNATFPPPQDKIIIYNATHEYDLTIYQGASIQSMYNLGRHLGYSLVATESEGYNLFFVRDDIDTSMFYRVNDVEYHYKTPKLGHRPCGENGRHHTEDCLKTYSIDGILGHKPDLLNRAWVDSSTFLKSP
mgnify:CR=1 FL=1|tara:strand:+ start:22997 stop:23914 length:918 start_codon:yes stop_codon:yes gene_type:complete